MVIIVDMLCVLSALLVALVSSKMKGRDIFNFLLLLILISFIVSLINMSPSPKFYRDIIIIPVFIYLGYSYRGDGNKLLLRIILLVSVVAIFEAFFPDLYGRVFDIKSYYINTRGVEESQFYSADSNLFVNATRPGEKFIPFLDFHRVSSVFLEPVSFGNFVIFFFVFVCVNFRYLSSAIRFSLIALFLFLLVLSDSRLGAFSCFLIAVYLFFNFRSIGMVLLPLLSLVTIVMFGLLGVPIYDNFSGRLSYTGMALLEMPWYSYLFGGYSYTGFVDSGIAYFIASQSIFSVIVVWFGLFGAYFKWGYGSFDKYRSALCVYMSLALMISYSVFSIKTASLFFFYFGYLYSISLKSR
jgi:putative polymerase